VRGGTRAGAKDDVEESGWKMVSGDVFRSPKDTMLLCVQLGSGVQIILASFITLFFAALGASKARFTLHWFTMQHPRGYPVFWHIDPTLFCRLWTRLAAISIKAALGLACLNTSSLHSLIPPPKDPA